MGKLTLVYASSYAKLGWKVMPLHGIDEDGCSCGRKECNDGNSAGKHPRTMNGSKDATDNFEEHKEYYQSNPCNIGIATGPISQLIVIDIDPRNGGLNTWAEMFGTKPEDEDTIIVRTGGGGLHLFYSHPACEVRGKLGPGIDVKSRGGYVVAPPSVHKSGKEYAFIKPPRTQELAELPEKILNIIKKESREKVVAAAKGAGRYWLEVAFEAAGWLGVEKKGRKFNVACPWENLHSTGVTMDGSTVLMPPTLSTKGNRGYFLCSHNHCQERTQREVFHALPEHARMLANEACEQDYEFEDFDSIKQLDVEQGKLAKTDADPAFIDAPSFPWTDLLSYTLSKDGRKKYIKDTANCIIAVENDPALQGLFRFNELRQEIEITRDFVNIKKGPMQDSTVVWVQQHLCNTLGVDFKKEHLVAVIEAVAQRFSYDPIKVYLESCQWDGVSRVKNMASKYYGAQDTPYNNAIIFKWLVGSIMRTYSPGCQFDTMLIFEGAQGCGKTRSLRKLFSEEWHTEDVGDIRFKDGSERLNGKWCVEIGELRSFSAADEETRKLFISKTVDSYRPAYARYVVNLPRRCVFAGTTNRHQYLSDETGNRRYWSLLCGKIDYDRIEAERDLLWAEVTMLYKNGEDCLLSKDMVQTQILSARERLEDDPWTPVIALWTSGRDHLLSTDVLTNCLHLEVSKQTSKDTRRVVKILQGLGFSLDASRGKRIWVRQ